MVERLNPSVSIESIPLVILLAVLASLIVRTPAIEREPAHERR